MNIYSWFLFSVYKCLYISGVDRLDKDLTIGQMQGNFLYPFKRTCSKYVFHLIVNLMSQCVWMSYTVNILACVLMIA